MMMHSYGYLINIEMAQPVVKGVTHCLLPDCNKLVWPFMNYCRKAHAEEGIKKGLKRELKQLIILIALHNYKLSYYH